MFIRGVLAEHAAACREQLGADRLDALWQEGCALTVEDALGQLDQVEAWR